MRKPLPLTKLALTLGSTIAFLAIACGSSTNDNSGPSGADGGGSDAKSGSDAKTPTPDASKPRPSDAGKVTEAGPPGPPPSTKPDGGGDAGKLTDAGLSDASQPPATGGATTLDAIDGSLMPDNGLALGSCSAVSLTDNTGRCWNDPYSGADFVQGCVGGTAYLLDCARYDTAGSTRSICQDDGTTVGCVLLSVTKVATFESGQTDQAFDMGHACPAAWNGYGYCVGDSIVMCQNGKDYSLWCGIYDFGSYTYTCGTDSTSGNLQCQ